MTILNIIKNIFKPGSTQQTDTKFKPDPNAYYFHEDFYCQIEYLPKENFSTITKVATEIIEHSEKTFDGHGWTGCYIRSKVNFPTKSKNFKVTELTDLLLNEGFLEYPNVTSGYGSTVFPCENIKAFKKQTIILCFDFKGDTIENIWHNDSPHPADNELFKKFLLTMATRYSLLLADWWKSIVIDISNPNEIEKYFVYDE